MKKLFLNILCWCSAVCAMSATAAVISLSSFNVPYTQDFNTLASSGSSSVVPAGWAFREVGYGDGLYVADNGSMSYSDTFSYGSSGSSDRAWGSVFGSVATTIGAGFQNDTGSTITRLAITYTGEQWRLGRTGQTDSMSFAYSLNATSLSDGNWTPNTALNFLSPNTSASAGQLNGNDALNRRVITAEISGLTFENGKTLWLRWADNNANYADDGLAVDDFFLTPVSAVPEPVNVSLGVFGVLAVVVGIIRRQLRKQ